ncbi:HupE/UreJ family protein [Flavobacterium branchiophilum]
MYQNMTEFYVYFQIGLQHVLNINAYDHVLFLMALTVPYTFEAWKKIVWLVSVFTIGHTLALVLSVFGILNVTARWIELLIPITIWLTAFSNIVNLGKSTKNSSNHYLTMVTLFFGIVHGLGFSNYFKSILGGTTVSKIAPLSSFALGIEASQMLVVFMVLLVGYCVQTLTKLSKRDWILTLSACIVGITLPLILQNEFWKN